MILHLSVILFTGGRKVYTQRYASYWNSFLFYKQKHDYTTLSLFYLDQIRLREASVHST